jgi:NAD(P)H dehydrogenase (quinone)
MPAQTKIAIIYYSATGTIYQLVQAAVEGAEKAGAEVRLRKVHELAPEEAIANNEGWSNHRLETQHVPEATLDDLDWADGVIFGTPTRYGLPAAQLKQFIDTTGPLWGQGKLADKVYGSIIAASTTHGGIESTALALNNVFTHWGGIIVPPGYTDGIKFADGNPYGTGHVAGQGTIPVDDQARAAAAYQATRIVTITTALKAGLAG